MESLQNIKKRLKSVSNVSQITKAMELVAATKMRKSQEIALASRPFAFLALGLLANISTARSKKVFSPLLEKRKIKRTLYVLISSDKGLAGAFNSSVFRKLENYLAENKVDSKKNLFLAIGEKSANYLNKKRISPEKKFVRIGDFTDPKETNPVSDYLADGYLNQKWDRVVVFSTNFRSALKQEPLIREILPIDFECLRKTVESIVPESGKFANFIKENQISFIAEKKQSYLIEPSPESVLEKLTRFLFSMQFYQLVLEANASEHAARRLAMKTASDNASKLYFNLSLQYNKSRQSTITREIIEITNGAQNV
ncbi:MAG: ATP synthase F1 subunit gamma [bacterium]|nr:ATP synthase F1 subunit gamma [bacterium]